MKGGPELAGAHTASATQPDLLIKMSTIINSTSLPAVVRMPVATDYRLRFKVPGVLVSKEDEPHSVGTSYYRSVSIATTSYRIPEHVRVTGPGTPELHQWGEITSQEHLTRMLTDRYQGSRLSQPNNVPAPLNTIEMKQMASRISSHLGLDADINGTHFWTQVWWAYGVHMIAVEALDSAEGSAIWSARPQPPVNVATTMNALNVIDTILPEITAGDHIMIELEYSESDLMPVIQFLLGLRPSHLDLDFGETGGNRRVPHILCMTPPNIKYTILWCDHTAVAGVDPADQPAGAGLAQGVIVNNPEFEPFSTSQVTRAFAKLARAVPHADGISSGYVKGLSRMFAELYHGIVDSAVGKGERYSNYGFMMTAEDSGIPGGDLSSCLLTLDHKTRAMTVEAVTHAAKLFNASKDILSIRCMLEPYIFSTQLSTRQLGFSAECMTPARPLVLAAGNNVSVSRTQVGSIRNAIIGQGGNPHQLGMMEAKFCSLLYEARLAVNTMYMEHGHNSDAHCNPYEGIARRCECLTSVTCTQLIVAPFASSASGVVGITNNVRDVLSEFRFTVGQHINVESETTCKTTNSSFMPGESSGGLGHAMMLTRSAAANVAGNPFKIQLQNLHNNSRSDNEEIDLVEIKRYAFVTSANHGVPPVSFRCALQQLDLFSDFDIVAAKIASLKLPRTPWSYSLMNNPIVRSNSPGFTELSLIGSVLQYASMPQMVDLNFRGTYVPLPKRRRVTINRNGPGGNGNNNNNNGNNE